MRIFTETTEDESVKINNDFKPYDKDYTLMYAEAIGTAKSIQSVLSTRDKFESMEMYSESPLSFFGSMFTYFKKAGTMILSLINKVISILFGKEIFNPASIATGVGSAIFKKVVELDENNLSEDYSEFKNDIKKEISNLSKGASEDTVKALLKALSDSSEDIDLSKYRKSIDTKSEDKSSLYDVLNEDNIRNYNDEYILYKVSEKLEDELVENNPKLDKSLEKLINGKTTNTIQRDSIKQNMQDVIFKEYLLKDSKRRFLKALKNTVKSIYKEFYNDLTVFQIENIEHILYLEDGSFNSAILNVIDIIHNNLTVLNDHYDMFEEWLRKLVTKEDFRDYDELDDIVISLKNFNNNLDGLLDNYKRIDSISEDTLDDVNPDKPKTFPEYIVGTDVSTLNDMLEVDKNFDNYYENSGHPLFINKKTEKMIGLYEQFDFSSKRNSDIGLDDFKEEMEELKGNINGLMSKMDDVMKTNTEKSNFITDEDKEQLKNIDALMAVSYNLISYTLSFHSIAVQQLRTAHLQIYIFTDIVINTAVAIIVKALKETIEEELEGGN